MIAFDAPSDALKFVVDFSINTGVDYIGIRVAIYSGEVHIRDNDIYGLTVNHASRVQGEIQREGILVGKSVMEAYNNTSGSLAQIRFSEEEKDLKDFGKEILCRANSTALRNARDAQRMARFDLLRSNVPRESRALRL